jgi:Fe-S oxidoreductase
LAHQRVRDAVEMGAEVLAVACPFCLLTLEDAVKILELEDKIQVMDIMELVVEAMG